ncbi:hypothetical protein ACM66B_003701 [Microbotryomycetes sp. NB124-2]
MFRHAREAQRPPDTDMGRSAWYGADEQRRAQLQAGRARAVVHRRYVVDFYREQWPPDAALAILDNCMTSRSDPNDKVSLRTCRTCGTFCLGRSNTEHRCPGAVDVEVPHPPPTVVLVTNDTHATESLDYPFELIDHISFFENGIPQG